MPPPFTLPLSTDDETAVESVREIARVASFSEVLARVNELNAAQWTAMEADVQEFQPYRGDFSQIKGGLLGYNEDAETARLAITNRVRERLGYERIDQYGNSPVGAHSTAGPVKLTF